MQNFKYKYTIKDRISGETLFSEITDLSQLGSLFQSDFFQYISTEAQMKRLGECKLENEDYICIVGFGNSKRVA
ncbi:hypothetical protein D9O36_14815 [Zobellia amurskyensis]|uniref:Uncharacterized protein n=1 Tax=Zobellia amurskyensis TaxID=248905 RepID=A0A7X2ZVG5_9FLAO|nr:hypothetical protein [Zobellia amurskyensis]MUH37122.1 hypothetical protein [Zobellia amurskyensis]